LDQLSLDRPDVVGRARCAMTGVVHLMLAREPVVARVRRSRGEASEARDQGEGEGGDADSVHG
jgi:hypothetical protein